MTIAELIYYLLSSYFIILTNIANWYKLGRVLVIMLHSSGKFPKGIHLRFITYSTVWVNGTAATILPHNALSYHC